MKELTESKGQHSECQKEVKKPPSVSFFMIIVNHTEIW